MALYQPSHNVVASTDNHSKTWRYASIQETWWQELLHDQSKT
jgi:hypothetical protein